MSTGLIDVIKRSALDAVNNEKMCDVRYGTVVSTSPLKVQVSNQFTIPAALLTVPEHLTDHTVEVTIDWTTASAGNHSHSYSGNTGNTSGGSDEAAFAGHNHTYGGETDEVGKHSHDMIGRRKLTIHNALKTGDRVALLRKQGGQSYFILDRI